MTIRWILSHSKIKGNEKADELARKAADHKSSRITDLPPYLRKSLPINASAEKQAFHEELLRTWEELWTASPRKMRLDETGASFPYTKLKKNLSKLNREQSSRIAQVRSRHIPLNAYPHRIGKTPSRNCRQCQDILGAQVKQEMVNNRKTEGGVRQCRTCSPFFDDLLSCCATLENVQNHCQRLPQKDLHNTGTLCFSYMLLISVSILILLVTNFRAK